MHSPKKENIPLMSSLPIPMRHRGTLVVALFVILALHASQTRVLHRVALDETRAKNASSSSEISLHKKRVASHRSSWCPSAVCHNSDLCHPCQRRFLIVVATGRSASTTLMYMMDSLPGVRMSGENNDTLGAIRKMISNIRDDRHFIRQQNKSARGAWAHNHVPDGAFACVAQHMIETITPPELDADNHFIHDDSDTIVGFKTIRLLDDRHSKYDEGIVRYVQENFPCARILVNIRSNTQEQAASYSAKPNFSKRMKGGKATVEKMNTRLRRVAELFGDQAMLLDSSDWTKNIGSLNRVVEWLGFHKICFFEQLLEFNTEGRGYGHGQTELSIHSDCRYVGKENVQSS